MPSYKRSSSKKGSSKSKSPSRKSSSRKSLSRVPSFDNSNVHLEYKPINPIYANIFSIIINALIIYYLINLEDVSCKCIMDWRHNYIKYFSGLIVLLNIIMVFSVHIISLRSAFSQIHIQSLNAIFLVISLVNIYALYTYVGDLNTTKCVCAVDKQKDLNTFLYYYRYLMLLLPILIIIGVVVVVFTLIIKKF